MKLTREQAIKALNLATRYIDWHSICDQLDISCIEKHGCSCCVDIHEPVTEDFLLAIGVTNEELGKAEL